MGDHATGVAEQVIYLVRGTMPDDPRPKADLLEGGKAQGASE
jgi:phosphate transport system protein